MLGLQGVTLLSWWTKFFVSEATYTHPIFIVCRISAWNFCNNLLCYECAVTQEWTASWKGMLRISVSLTNVMPLQVGISSRVSPKLGRYLSHYDASWFFSSFMDYEVKLSRFFSEWAMSKAATQKGMIALSDRVVEDRNNLVTLLRLGRLIFKAWPQCACGKFKIRHAPSG